MKNYKLSILNSKKISNAKSDDQIRRLYETAFPEDEQIPWDDLMRLVGEMPLDFTAYYDGEDFIGFTIVYPRKQFNRRTKQGQSETCSNYALQGGGRPKVNWYWYFAVREELRGKGYGQQILTQLIEKYKGQTCVLDMESPTQVCENIEQRRRRHDFYLRNGFRDTNVYRTYNDITMTIMMMGERQRVGDGTSGMGALASPSSDATQPSSSELGRPSLLPRFTMQDWDDITHELQQFWWPDDIREDDMME